jgi:prepilin-type N-terminal cleavage/methylation domain-containing protein
MRKNTASGFTLLELFFVISVIGILAAILLPALAKTREQARRSACFSNLEQFGVALHLYSLEHKGEFPWSGGHNDARCFAELYPEYITNATIYMCPSDPEFNSRTALTNSLQDESESFRMSYDYLGAWTNEPIKVDLEDPIVRNPNAPLVWDIFSASKDIRRASHAPVSGNVLFLDGTVQYKRAKDWAAANLPAKPEGISFDEELLRDMPVEEFYQERR